MAHLSISEPMQENNTDPGLYGVRCRSTAERSSQRVPNVSMMNANSNFNDIVLPYHSRSRSTVAPTAIMMTSTSELEVRAFVENCALQVSEALAAAHHHSATDDAIKVTNMNLPQTPERLRAGADFSSSPVQPPITPPLASSDMSGFITTGTPDSAGGKTAIAGFQLTPPPSSIERPLTIELITSDKATPVPFPCLFGKPHQTSAEAAALILPPATQQPCLTITSQARTIQACTTTIGLPALAPPPSDISEPLPIHKNFPKPPQTPPNAFTSSAKPQTPAHEEPEPTKPEPWPETKPDAFWSLIVAELLWNMRYNNNERERLCAGSTCRLIECMQQCTPLLERRKERTLGVVEYEEDEEWFGGAEGLMTIDEWPCWYYGKEVLAVEESADGGHGEEEPVAGAEPMDEDAAESISPTEQDQTTNVHHHEMAEHDQSVKIEPVDPNTNEPQLAEAAIPKPKPRAKRPPPQKRPTRNLRSCDSDAAIEEAKKPLRPRSQRVKRLKMAREGGA